MENVKVFFDKQAPGYKNVHKGIFKVVRNYETRSLQGYLANIPKGEPFIDLGAGAGHYTHLLQRLGFTKIEALDISVKMLQSINLDVKSKIVGDLNNLDYNVINAKNFLAMGSLEFCTDPHRAIHGIIDKLEDQKILIVMVPLFSPFSLCYKIFYALKGIKVTLLNKKHFLHSLLQKKLFVEVKFVFPFNHIIKITKNER